MRARPRLPRPLFVFSIAVLVAAAYSSATQSQPERVFDMEAIELGMASGFLDNTGKSELTAFHYELRRPEAAWGRVEMTNVTLNSGDFIRLTSLKTGQHQIIRDYDPQLSEPSLDGHVYSVILNGGMIDVELVLAPGSRNAHMEIERVLVASRAESPTGGLCGADNRTPVQDPCVFRIVGTNGNVGSGFMIGENCMLSAGHVFAQGVTYVAQRNVPMSSILGELNHPDPSDQFIVSSVHAGVGWLGSDWAVALVLSNLNGPPGDGCSPQFACEFENTTPPQLLTVKGYGADAGPWNHILQLDTGPSMVGGVNGNHFRFQVDVMPGNSGGPALDQAGRIVGIVTHAGCEKVGANAGTLIRNIMLRASIRNVCGSDICPVLQFRLHGNPRPSTSSFGNAADVASYSWTEAPANTTTLYSQAFNAGSQCNQSGWVSEDLSGRGLFASVSSGSSTVQNDPCARDLSCVWGFFNGSQDTYSCGGFPLQPVVPYAEPIDEPPYAMLGVVNRIVSPWIPYFGTGDEVLLQFSTYTDLDLDGMVFYNWQVRSWQAGMPGPWRTNDRMIYGSSKQWELDRASFGPLIDPSAEQIQVALAVYDMADAWSYAYGTGSCHSHSPLFDNVKVVRVNKFGPQWQVNEGDLFQDNFAADGSTTGTVRADIAYDIAGPYDSSILPGDSAIVTVSDAAGIAQDMTVGGPAVYLYVRVDPPHTAKSGSSLTDDSFRWPVTGSVFANGQEWFCVRMDKVFYDTGRSIPALDQYCVDLNDDLFQPGDVVQFFFAARDINSMTTYWSENAGMTSQIDQAAASACEMTCLPDAALEGQTDILYVDGANHRGVQRYFDTAFESMGVIADHFDVRDPSTLQNNGLGSRVVSVVDQLTPFYRKIIWDCGDLPTNLGDGSWGGHKSDDYGAINTFLANLSGVGGVYLGGDNVASQLDVSVGASAQTFRYTYMPFTLSAPSHRSAFGLSPVVQGLPGGCFSGDSFYAYGGCPLAGDFDVMTPVGASLMEMSYGPPASNNGAVLSHVTGATVKAMLAGFSFMRIRDNEEDGVIDRARQLHNILVWLGNYPDQPTATAPTHFNYLEQNFPNPFNPVTTITFSLAANANVELKIFDARGALVRTLLHEPRRAGENRVTWDGRNEAGTRVASGVFFYRLSTEGFISTRKMVLLK